MGWLWGSAGCSNFFKEPVGGRFLYCFMNYMKGYKFQLQKVLTCFVSDKNDNKELHTYYSYLCFVLYPPSNMVSRASMLYPEYSLLSQSSLSWLPSTFLNHWKTPFISSSYAPLSHHLLFLPYSNQWPS